MSGKHGACGRGDQRRSARAAQVREEGSARRRRVGGDAEEEDEDGGWRRRRIGSGKHGACGKGDQRRGPHLAAEVVGGAVEDSNEGVQHGGRTPCQLHARQEASHGMQCRLPHFHWCRETAWSQETTITVRAGCLDERLLGYELTTHFTSFNTVRNG